MKTQVSSIQRYSVNDGYGIRTIVFLTGCTMRCAWCQNPETISRKPSLMFIASNCAGCGACRMVCGEGAAAGPDGSFGVDRSRCISCFNCAGECYFNARKPSGSEWDMEDVFCEVMKDEAFFKNSGGGLTLSGGEPLMQPQFCRELLQRVQEQGVHTAVETAGNVPYGAFIQVVPFTDLFLYDIKLMDEQKHIEWTGVSNRQILGNLKRLARTRAEVIVRVPLIAGVNDGGEFDAIADYAAGLETVKELHILPYHSLGADKYSQLNLPYRMVGQAEENQSEILRCQTYAQSLGLRVSVGGAGFAAEG